MTRTLASACALLLLAMAAPASGQQDFAAAKDLYLAAKYEESLGLLDRLKEAKPPADEALAVEQYRAVCLLALNRKAEAEQAIEGVAEIDPFFQPAEDDVAPWVRAAFRDARRKVLPAALQRLYGRAKEAYDRKALPEAISGFKRVLALLDDPDLTLDKGALGDMRMVTRGFLDLSEAAGATAAAAKPAAAAPAGDSGTASSPQPPAVRPGQAPDSAAAPGPTGTRSAAPARGGITSAPVIYDAGATDVTPPLPVRRDLPAFPGAPRVAAGTAVVVDIVVGENGSIESAVVRQSAGKYYDEMVVQSARNWRYRPATRNGKAVKYRLLVKVVVAAPSPGTAPEERLPHQP